MKHSLNLFLLLLLFVSGYGQNVTSRITVNTGNHVEFYFNHLNDYDNGISLENYTRLKIYYNDTADFGGAGSGSGWKLTVKSLDASIQSTYSPNTLPLSTIELRVTHNMVTNTYTLSATDVIIASGPDKLDYTADIDISYDVGKTDKIDIVSNERFAVDLKFTIQSQ